MTYFLDTNICIYHLNDSAPCVSDRLERMSLQDIKIPSIVMAELLYGAEKSDRREQNLDRCREFLSVFEIVPFDDKAAEHYAIIRAKLERKGSIIGGNDMAIAAIVLANNGIMVSHDTDEFFRVDGLAVEDWAKPCSK